MKLKIGGRMLDYLKMANRVIIVLCLVLLTSVCFAQPTDTNDALIEEATRAKEAVMDISKYISENMFCFETIIECKQENQRHVDNMANFLVDKEWKYEDYSMRMELITEPNGERYLVLGVIFRSYVNPKAAYNALWTIKKMVKKEKDHYVENSGILKRPYLCRS
jgi:hypothetical protein